MSSHPSPIRTLIVDDESHGRDVVRLMLARHTDVEIVGEAATGLRALEEIRARRPDLVFLDVRMPRLDGMQLMEKLGSDAPPVTVLITAHDGYAVEAFARSAFDYLLKPFDHSRFDQMMDRVRERFRTLREAELGRRVRDAIGSKDSSATSTTRVPEASSTEAKPPTRFVVKEGGRVFFVPIAAADWLEASGNYVALHVGKKTHLIYDTLTNIERQLDSRSFLRIHRSTIVNVERIKELEPFANGEFVVILHDGTHLKLSRNFREKANQALGL